MNFLLDLDPNVVKPGWTPLIITIILAAAIALLYISMRRQFRKIRVPDDPESTGSTTPATRDQTPPAAPR